MRDNSPIFGSPGPSDSPPEEHCTECDGSGYHAPDCPVVLRDEPPEVERVYDVPVAPGEVLGFHGSVTREQGGTFTSRVSVRTHRKPYSIEEKKGHATSLAALAECFGALARMGVK